MENPGYRDGQIDDPVLALQLLDKQYNYLEREFFTMKHKLEVAKHTIHKVREVAEERGYIDIFEALGEDKL